MSIEIGRKTTGLDHDQEVKCEKNVQLASGDSVSGHYKSRSSTFASANNINENNYSVEDLSRDFKKFVKSTTDEEILQATPYNSSKNASDDSGCFVNSETSSNSAEPNQRTNLIVNYLPPSLTQEDVVRIFSECGIIESCKLICEKYTNESLGYAFVKYLTQEDAERAIQMFNGKKIEKKFIKVSFARPSSDEIKGANLYICNVPMEMKQVELEDLFGKYGEIITARILFDTETGLSRGIAFVRFDKKYQADSAIENLNGYQMVSTSSKKGYLNDPLIVKYANTPTFMKYQDSFLKEFDSPVENQFRVKQLSRHLSTPIRKSSFEFHSDYLPQQHQQIQQQQPRQTLKRYKSKGWIISVTHLSPYTEEFHLWQLFGPFGAVQNVFIVRDIQTGLCKGYAFITMNNYEEALLAGKTLNGYELNDVHISVSLKLPNYQMMREIEMASNSTIDAQQSNNRKFSSSFVKRPKVSQSFIRDISSLEKLNALVKKTKSSIDDCC